MQSMVIAFASLVCTTFFATDSTFTASYTTWMLWLPRWHLKHNDSLHRKQLHQGKTQQSEQFFFVTRMIKCMQARRQLSHVVNHCSQAAPPLFFLDARQFLRPTIGARGTPRFACLPRRSATSWHYRWPVVCSGQRCGDALTVPFIALKFGNNVQFLYDNVNKLE